MARNYAVESIGPGKKRGKITYHHTLSNAKKKARSEYKTGRGVSLDKLSDYGSMTVAQKGMARTGFGKDKSKFGKKFVRSFGKL
jgi:hypothetical protein